ncbi:MAG: DUF3592 domain-containing protein [Eubacterium sp.]
MKKRRIPIEIILPIISIIAGIILAGYITYDYANECENTKWPSVEASVIDMNSYEEANTRRRIGKTVYVITYSYDINGVEYNGETRSYTPILVGDSLEIKYNPESPSTSTAITKPDTQRFIIILLFSIVLIAAGVLFTIMIWQNRFLLTYEAEDKPYYHEPKQKRNPKSYLGFLLPIGVFLLAIVLMYYQPFMQKNINADEFIQIMYSDGYETENSLDRLQTEFGMGSLIEEAYSVNTEDLRIDFCAINTSRNAEMLYSSASLPADKQVISRSNFVAAEDDEFFYVKAMKNNTFVYGACKIELKDELLRLIEDMNYYNEQ